MTRDFDPATHAPDDAVADSEPQTRAAWLCRVERDEESLKDLVGNFWALILKADAYIGDVISAFPPSLGRGGRRRVIEVMIVSRPPASPMASMALRDKFSATCRKSSGSVRVCGGWALG